MFANIKLYIIITLGGLLFASAGYAWIERGARQAAQARVEILTKQIESKERALAEVQAEARAAQARARRFERIRQDVASATDSRACAESPAVRAALRGLYGSRPDGGSTSHPNRTAGAPSTSR